MFPPLSSLIYKVNVKVTLRLVIMQNHNTELLVTTIREQFKRNMHEKDPEKIQKMKDE